MADSNPTRRSTPTPPAVGRPVSVRVLDEDMRDDLAVLMRAHGTAAEPLRLAVRLLARAYRRAWCYREVPDGTAPHIIAIRYALPDGTPEQMPNPAHTAYPHVRDVSTADAE
ncbi:MULTISPECIES: hypothetical protein [Streptomyces]|uniref:hypothetical protein n=1 Tax=Streptomyces TaxID=1883 RepID=UPI000690DB8D|nr:MULTISPECIES: hypothetical protein [Streptomyces]